VRGLLLIKNIIVFLIVFNKAQITKERYGPQVLPTKPFQFPTNGGYITIKDTAKHFVAQKRVFVGWG